MADPEMATICPRCFRLVEAKDFMDRFYVGALESVLPRIQCPCGYIGLPIEVAMEEYRKYLRDGQ